MTTQRKANGNRVDTGIRPELLIAIARGMRGRADLCRLFTGRLISKSTTLHALDLAVADGLLTRQHGGGWFSLTDAGRALLPPTETPAYIRAGVYHTPPPPPRRAGSEVATTLPSLMAGQEVPHHV